MLQDNAHTRETHGLIASNKVEGTAVYGQSGEKLGSISHFMVGKRDGQVNYAIMSFGGFLGLGTDEFTLPWQKLDYDVDKGGYVVDVTKEQLEGAPRYVPDQGDMSDQDYYDGVSSYYGYSERV